MGLHYGARQGECLLSLREKSYKRFDEDTWDDESHGGNRFRISGAGKKNNPQCHLVHHITSPPQVLLHFEELVWLVIANKV